ncbi:MAG: hypothetical protein K6G10_01605 [Butyrivibrio sp.]|nr:hypothetical protein [Butyrivibrio sp.]
MVKIIEKYRRTGSELCFCCGSDIDTKRIRWTFGEDGANGTSIVLCKNCRQETIKVLSEG